MNEAETRAEHIAPALKAAGWGVVPSRKILREYPIAPSRIEGPGRRGKALTADYVLVYCNRKLAVQLAACAGRRDEIAGEVPAVSFSTLLEQLCYNSLG